MKGKGTAGPHNIAPHFWSHSVFWPSRNYHRYSTHHFHLFTPHESGGFPPSFHYSKLENLQVKSPLSVPSVSRHVLSNIWIVFLLIVSTTLPKPTTCSVDSKRVFVKDGAGFTSIVQAVEDGFQQRLMKGSVLTLLDFSKAYNTVWREKLLLHMLNIGIPPTIIRSIRSFLNDRRGRLQPFDVFGSSWCYMQGLPQGFVLVPLLFLFYINDLASSLNNDTVIALFADNVSILTTAWKKEGAEAAAHSVVNSVVIWSKVWKLNLNADKARYVSSLLGQTTAPGIPLSLLTHRNSCQHYSSSLRCNSGYKLNIQRTSKETIHIAYI